MKTVICYALALLFCGCSVIHSQHPVGLTPKDISNEVEEWEGFWQTTDGAIFPVFVIDASNGLIRVVGFDQDGDEIKKESFDIYLRDANEWTFASMAEEDNDEGLYLWGRIKMDKRVIFVWTPNEKLTELIENKTLPSTTNKNDSVLGALTTNHYDVICSDSEDVLFEWDAPMVFWKMSK